MMTVVAIMAGLMPIMWSHGTGSEVMQRIEAITAPEGTTALQRAELQLAAEGALGRGVEQLEAAIRTPFR